MALEKKTKVVLVGEDHTARAFKSAANNADKLGKRITGLSLKTAGFAAVGVAAAAGLLLMTKRAIENADAIGKTADAVGIGVEQLQEYRHAAELSGVETEAFDKSLEQFTKRVGEAREGTGALVEFLKKNNSELVGSITASKDAGEALDIVFRAMANTADQSDRAALAAAAFGRSGVKLTNIVRGGAASLDEMRAEARRLGLVLDETMVRSAEDANDAMLRMEKIVGVNLQKVLISLSPVIVRVGEAFGDAAPLIAEFTQSIAEFAFGDAVRDTADLQAELVAINQTLDGSTLVMNALAGATSKVTLGLVQLDNSTALEKRKKELTDLIALREREAKLPPPGGGTTKPDGGVDEKQRALADKFLATIEQANLKAFGREKELLDMREAQQLEHLDRLNLTYGEKLAARTTIEETFNKLRAEKAGENQQTLEAQAAEHLARMNQGEKSAAALNQAIWKSGLAGKVQIGGAMMGQLSGLMESNSKRMFAIGKAAAIGETIISTVAAAQRAYQAFAWNPPLAAAMAGVATLAGMARVQQIRSQSFGGGGGSASAAGGGAAPPAGPGGALPALAPANDPRPAERVVNLTIVGNVIDAALIRDEIIPLFNEAADDGVQIRVNVTQSA